MFSPLSVRKMLDYVDCDAKSKSPCKRRDAYVTEKYFEADILPVIANGSTSTGWCYIEENWIRHWFKVIINIHDNEAERNIDRQIIQKLKEIDERQRFFIVSIDSNLISLREIIEENGKPVLRTVSVPFCDIERMNQEALRLSELPDHPAPFSEKWLKNYGEYDLITLLIQRLLMNIGLGNKFPLDVDAIEINNDQLIFHEFKRKNKCPNGCFIIENESISKSKLLTVLRKCNEKKLIYGTELFEFVEAEFGYKRDENAQCYGLDMSHLSNYEFCINNNIQYIHTIWDSGDYPDKPDISDLFNEDIKPRNGIRLISKRLEENDFCGFIFTGGTNSGSFTTKLRIQATLDAGVLGNI